MFTYVSAVEGSLVPRFSAMNNPLPEFIGATRHGRNITWSDAIVRIPAVEWAKFRREYSRAVNSGALVLRTEAEYEVQTSSGNTGVTQEGDA